MCRCTWIRSLRLSMVPAIVLCVGATSFAAIDFSNNTLTYSSTSDLSTTIDPAGQNDVTVSYGLAKDSFLALSPQVVAFNGAPAPSQTLRTLIVSYDASNTVTFTFPADMYNYGSMSSKGRGAFSGSSLQDAISTVPVLNDGFYDWFDARITSTGGKGVQALGFCVGFRNDQLVAAGQVLFTLSDATTATIALPVLGGGGVPEYVFIGYQAPGGKTITRVQAARTSQPGGGYVSIDDLAFVMSTSGADDCTPPDVVFNLATSAPTASSLTLTWTAPGDDGSIGLATSYDIRYRTDGPVTEGNWASATQVTGEPIPAGPGTVQNMVVTGLSPSTTYYFAIKTSDEVPNVSAISNSPSGTTSALDTTAPAAVSNLTISNPTSNSITLSWTAPGDDGNTGTATTYDIRYRTGGAIDASNWASATQCTGEPTPLAAGNNQTFVVNGLSSSTTYYFAIKTADEVPNWSGLSNSPSGTTTAPGPSAKIALKRDPGLMAGGAIDARFAGATVVTTRVQDAVLYGVQQSRWYNGGTAGTSSGGSTGDSWVTYKYDLASVPAYAHINLAQLRLNTAGGIGTPSLAMILTHDWIEGTTNWNYPGAAGGITYWAPIGYNTDFNQNPSGSGSQPWGGWGPNSDSGLNMAVDGGPVVNPSSWSGGYVVYDVTADVQTWARGIRPNFGWVQLDYARFSLSESGSDTQPVLFIDYAVEGDTTPPATIANLATSNVTNSSVTLTWTAPGDDGSTGTAASYDIRYAKSPITAASWALATPATGIPAPQAAGTVQGLVISGLVSNTTYYFAMKASDEVPNVTPISNVVSATTPVDTIAPAAVANLAAGNATNHSLTLTWTAPGDDGNIGTATSYDIRYSTSTINAGNWASATQVTNEPVPAAAGTSQSLVVDNLTQNTTYYFAMKTSDEVPNTSGLSNVASGQTLPDIIPPGAVTSLAVTKTKASALRLAWIASGDDGDFGTATSYDVRYRTGGPVTEGNWASCTQATGAPVPVQPGYHRNMWVYGLSASTTYYIGIKALDEVGNASTIATASATTPAASNLTRPLLQPSDLEFLGAFKLPQFACGMSTAYALAGLAVRQVNGNLHFLACTHVYADGVYECNFPGWGTDQSTWPQSSLIREWGMAVYNPVLKQGSGDWTAGLNYDQATGRLYYSSCNIYYVSQVNIPSLGCALLQDSGPVVLGPWMSQNVSVQVMRGGSLTIPDWFADTYLDGRKLGVGFGGPWSGWASCAPGPALAAAHHPDGSTTDLDTIRLLQYDHTWPDHWAKRDGGYWWRDGVPVYDCHLPDGDIGYWTSFDSCTGIWVDLPDKQGLLYATSKGYGGQYYDYGSPDSEWYENWWRIYDPADLADVAQGSKNSWEPQHEEWPMQGFPNPPPGSHRPGATGIAFDAQTRTVFLIVPQSYNPGGQEWYPVVYGYHIKQSPIWKVGDINHDGYVNVGDLQALVVAWGSQAGPPASSNWNADADINTDGSVNIGDLQLLVAHWGE